MRISLRKLDDTTVVDFTDIGEGCIDDERKFKSFMQVSFSRVLNLAIIA